MKHWHRCSRWWRLNLECPYSSLVQHEDEEDDPVPVAPELEDPRIRDVEESFDEVVPVGDEVKAVGHKPIIPLPGKKKGKVKDEFDPVKEAEKIIRDLPRRQRQIQKPTEPRIRVPVHRRVRKPVRKPASVQRDAPQIETPVGDLRRLTEKAKGSQVVQEVLAEVLSATPSDVRVPNREGRVADEKKAFDESVEALQGLAAAYGTSVLQDWVPDIMARNSKLLGELRAPIEVPRNKTTVRATIAFPRTRIAVEEKKPENVKAGIAEEVLLQQMALEPQSAREPTLVTKERDRRIPSLTNIAIGGAAAAGAAGVGGFFFNARQRMAGLLSN